MKRIPEIAANLILGMALATGVTAQPSLAPGDVVAATGNALFRMPPQGGLTTLVTGLPFRIQTVVPAPDNRGVMAIGNAIAHIANDGTVTTVIPVTAGLDAAFGVVDGDGNLYLGGQSGQALFYKVAPGGLLSTLLDARSSLSWGMVVGGGLDPWTGDLIVAGRPLAPAADGLFRVSTGASPGLTTLCGIQVGPTISYGGHIHHEPATGDLLYYAPDHLYRISPTAPHAVATLHQGPPLGIASGLDHDPARRDYLLGTCYHSMPNPAIPCGILRFDPSTSAFVTLNQGQPPFSPTSVTVAGRRHLGGLTEPMPGGPYTMIVSSPAEPGAAYAVALSLATHPGIALPDGRQIHLTPDPLCVLSLTSTGIFQGFLGFLDTRGEAYATVNLPPLPGLSGLRLFASAITIVQGRVSTIAETIGVTVR